MVKPYCFENLDVALSMTQFEESDKIGQFLKFFDLEGIDSLADGSWQQREFSLTNLEIGMALMTATRESLALVTFIHITRAS